MCSWAFASENVASGSARGKGDARRPSGQVAAALRPENEHKSTDQQLPSPYERVKTPPDDLMKYYWFAIQRKNKNEFRINSK